MERHHIVALMIVIQVAELGIMAVGDDPVIADGRILNDGLRVDQDCLFFFEGGRPEKLLSLTDQSDFSGHSPLPSARQLSQDQPSERGPVAQTVQWNPHTAL